MARLFSIWFVRIIRMQRYHGTASALALDFFC